MNKPKVSIIIPARNEEKWIGPCLDSILANDFAHGDLEILVIDGMSEDGTRDIVQRYSSRAAFVRLLSNPRRIIPAALNIGIREAQGEIIVRMDAHTTYATDYLRKAVDTLETSGAAMVGAIQAPVGDTFITRAIASATSSPFGVGNSYYHYGKESRWVEDSVYLGVWRKKTLTELAQFNETWLVNEDSELNHRLRAAGGRIFLSAELRCSYHVRASLRALARQYFRYGMWRAKTSIRHPSTFGLRQMACPAFAASLLLSLLVAPISLPLALFVPCLYGLVNLSISAAIVRRQGWKHFLVPLAFFTIHISWGTGFWVGLVRFCTTAWKQGAEPAPISASVNSQNS